VNLRDDVETTVDKPQLKAMFEAAAAVRPACRIQPLRAKE
jgi:hypothetical protein